LATAILRGECATLDDYLMNLPNCICVLSLGPLQGGYAFPPAMRLKNRFKLVGQSVNCHVVEHVMRAAFLQAT
jgi:hypothetical protein